MMIKQLYQLFRKLLAETVLQPSEKSRNSLTILREDRGQATAANVTQKVYFRFFTDGRVKVCFDPALMLAWNFMFNALLSAHGDSNCVVS